MSEETKIARRICEDCYHWRDGGSGQGTCRAHPGTIVRELASSPGGTQYPVMYSFDDCGEWFDKETRQRINALVKATRIDKSGEVTRKILVIAIEQLLADIGEITQHAGQHADLVAHVQSYRGWWSVVYAQGMLAQIALENKRTKQEERSLNDGPKTC